MSGQTLDDGEGKGAKTSSNALMSTLKNETVLLGFASGAAYFFAYSFERGYLGYFNIGPEFVQVTATDLLVVCSFLSAIFFVGWIFLGLVPVKIIEPFLKTVLIGFPAVPLFINGIVSYTSYGVSWLMFANLAFGILFLLFLLVSLYRSLTRGRKVEDWVQEQVSSELEMRGHFATQALLSKLDIAPTIVFTLFLLGPIVGSALGRFYADSRQQFQQITINENDYVVVSDFLEGFLIVGVEMQPNGRVRSTFASRWIPTDELSKKDMVIVRALADGLSGPSKRRHWVPFAVFWEENFGNPTGSNRP